MRDETSEPKEHVDLVMRRFWLTATPRVFEWLRWAGTLAALKYVQQKVHSTELNVLLAVLSLLLLNYLVQYFLQFAERAYSGPWRKTKIISVGFFALGMGLLTFWLVNRIVDAIVLSQA